jgi:hypothetical protein
LVFVAREIWTGLLLIGFGSRSNQNQIGLVFYREEQAPGYSVADELGVCVRAPAE